MIEWVRALLDIVLIVMVGIGLAQVTRLIKHLAGLREGRIEMERFVHEFNATVTRAEAGIKGLKQAARNSGDDLEKLVDKALLVRDELSFIVESADQIAERLSQSATNAVRPAAAVAEAKPVPKTTAPPPPATAEGQAVKKEVTPTSKAEQELMQALKKLN